MAGDATNRRRITSPHASTSLLQIPARISVVGFLPTRILSFNHELLHQQKHSFNAHSATIPARTSLQEKKHNLEPKMTHKRGCFGNDMRSIHLLPSSSSQQPALSSCCVSCKRPNMTTPRATDCRVPHATSVISIGPTLQRAETRTSVPDVVFHSSIHCLSSRLWRPRATSRREWWRSGGSCTKDAARTAADSYTHDLHHSAPHHRDRQLGLSRME